MGGSGSRNLPRLDHHPTRPAASLRSSSRRYTRDDIGGALMLVDQCLVDEWKELKSESYGFAEKMVRCTGILHKDCSTAFCSKRSGSLRGREEGRRFSIHPHSKPTEHFQYNHIPAQFAAVEKVVVRSVISYYQNLVVLHLVKSKAKARPAISLFCLVDLKCKRKKFRGTFGEQEFEVNRDGLYCQVSPDKSIMALLVPQRSTSSGMLHIYSTTSLQELTRVQLANNFTKFAFDPRFKFDRLAITSLTQSNSISLIENILDPEVIVTHDVLENARSSIRLFRQPFLGGLVYTKDGSLIVANLIDVRCLCSRNRNLGFAPNQLFILNGESLQTLHVLAFEHSICAFHLCPINYVPVFSHCGSKMALAGCVAGGLGASNVERGGNSEATVFRHIENVVSIYQLPISRTLQSLCRITILEVLQKSKVNELPLPHRLIDFLKFKPEYN